MKTTLAFLTLLIGQSFATATTFTFNFDSSTLPSLQPQGTPPWVTATFTDQAPGTTRVTFSASGLVGTELVEYWYFNVTPEHVGHLTFTPVGQIGSFQTTIHQGLNGKGTDLAIGLYPNPYSFDDLFGPGDSFTLDIASSQTGLDALDFYTWSQSNIYGGQPFYTTAAVSGVRGTGTLIDLVIFAPWSVPDSGSTLLLFGSALIALYSIQAIKRFRSRS
jgi:VPDSG-CTERM motif